MVSIHTEPTSSSLASSEKTRACWRPSTWPSRCEPSRIEWCCSCSIIRQPSSALRACRQASAAAPSKRAFMFMYTVICVYCACTLHGASGQLIGAAVPCSMSRDELTTTERPSNTREELDQTVQPPLPSEQSVVHIHVTWVCATIIV